MTVSLCSVLFAFNVFQPSKRDANWSAVCVVSGRGGGWHAGGSGRGLNDFTALSLCPAASSFLSQTCRGRKVDIVFLSCVLSVLKHIQMCAALFLYNTRREQKKREREKDFFFFIYSSLFFKGTRLKVSWRETVCVCVFGRLNWDCWSRPTMT